MTTVDEQYDLEALMVSEEAVPDGPERLWFEREHLETIRQFAKARFASPWATLGVVLLRALATVPPHVTLPPTIGGRASLNMFLALTGSSGAGKGAAMSVAREAVQIIEPIPTLPLGSGEGLVKAYASREIDEVDGEKQPITKMHTTSVLFETSEVDQFRAQGQRTGSTLLPQLRSAYSGEQLGATYATVEKAVVLQPHSYRLGLVVGVQPKRADALLDDGDGGTPQRFVWLPVGDPDPAAGIDAPPPYRLPAISWSSTHQEMKIPAEARESIISTRMDVLRGIGDPLDGHAMLTRLKVAAAFAILDGRQNVNREDWRLSGIVMEKSRETRRECITALRSVRNERAIEQGRTDAVRQQAKEATVEQQRTERALDRISGLITKHARDSGGITKGELNRKLASRDRDYFDEALSRAMRTGRIECSGEEVTPC